MSTLKTRFAARSAKTLRSDATDAERRLWSRLRDRRLSGHKFVRQLPVGPYIADFACREADLIIELDGSQHGDEQGAGHDARRAEVLAGHGYRIVRFWNIDILKNMDGTLEAILAELGKAPSPGLRFAKPDLSPQGEVVPTASQGKQS